MKIKRNPKVTIIIPTYKRNDMLLRALQSLSEITNKEIIVVNDDRGSKIPKEILDMDITVYDGGGNGVSNARNVGLSHASGEYVYFMDDDDYVTTDFIHGLNNEELVEKVYRFNLDRFHKGKLTTKYYNHGSKKYLKEKKKGYASYSASFLVRRNILIENKISFPPTMTWAEDQIGVALVWEVCNKQTCINISSLVYVIHEKEKNSLSRPLVFDFDKRWRNAVEFKKLIVGNDSLGRYGLLLKQVHRQCISHGDNQSSAKVKNEIIKLFKKHGGLKISSRLTMYEKIESLFRRY